jgi:hypothetical protein
MQIDLALFLRLSRTLERTAGGVQAPAAQHAAVLKALDRFVVAIDELEEMLRPAETPPPLPTQIALEATKVPEQKTEVAPAVPRPAEAEAVPEAAPGVWSREHDLLYEDVLWLFKVGDNEGALVSLGRLLALASETPELQRFADINEKKLLGLYEKVLGSFSMPFTVGTNGLGDRYFHSMEEAQTVYRQAREHGTVAELLEASPMSRLKTLALMHRFQIERLMTFPAGANQPHAAH